MSKEPAKKKKKFASLHGYSESNIHEKISHMNKVPHKGDWRRFRKIEDVMYRQAKIIWKRNITITATTDEDLVLSDNDDDDTNRSNILVIEGPAPIRDDRSNFSRNQSTLSQFQFPTIICGRTLRNNKQKLQKEHVYCLCLLLK